MRKVCWVIVTVLAVMFCQNIGCAKEYHAGNESFIKSQEVLQTGVAKKPGKPFIASIFATSKGTIKMMWSPVKNADKYEIYRSKKKKSRYKKIATTKKTSYTDKKGKALQTYYYKIRAVSGNGKGKIYSAYSNAMKKKVRKPAKKTAYAGDSLMAGLINYGKIKENKSRKLPVYFK